MKDKRKKENQNSPEEKNKKRSFQVLFITWLEKEFTWELKATTTWKKFGYKFSSVLIQSINQSIVAVAVAVVIQP